MCLYILLSNENSLMELLGKDMEPGEAGSCGCSAVYDMTRVVLCDSM